jgi:hypothetical protein
LHPSFFFPISLVINVKSQAVYDVLIALGLKEKEGGTTDADTLVRRRREVGHRSSVREGGGRSSHMPPSETLCPQRVSPSEENAQFHIDD